ncbi:MAG: hypothetical protein PHD76_13925 [Methylacidiphilales bacterium]|nr:hypothetical protein [Candidatus Methylacidiphilales bacterium]
MQALAKPPQNKAVLIQKSKQNTHSGGFACNPDVPAPLFPPYFGAGHFEAVF